LHCNLEHSIAIDFLQRIGVGNQNLVYISGCSHQQKGGVNRINSSIVITGHPPYILRSNLDHIIIIHIVHTVAVGNPNLICVYGCSAHPKSIWYTVVNTNARIKDSKITDESKTIPPVILRELVFRKKLIIPMLFGSLQALSFCRINKIHNSVLWFLNWERLTFTKLFQKNGSNEINFCEIHFISIPFCFGLLPQTINCSL
jgi:hypothetical protein